MLSSSDARRRGALDFEGCYDHVCATQGSAPIPAVKTTLTRGVLDFNGDRIGPSDWTPIFSSLSINKQLNTIAVRSCYIAGLATQGSYHSSVRKKTPPLHSKAITYQLCKAVQKCLSVSTSLKTLQLQGIPLRERDLNLLTKGLAKSVSLENLSLAHCPIADQGLAVICQSVKYSSSIKTVDFTNCNITWQGAEHMANIVKHQGTRRHTTSWAESLRYRKPEFEAMSGLRRLTLNGNILIGDRGAAALAQELREDLWVKAVDLQKCGVSNEGARVLLEMLKINTTICVLDIRRNPLVDNDLVKAVIQQVLVNTNNQDSQYLWIKPPSKDAPEQPGQGRRGSSGRRKTTKSVSWRSSTVSFALKQSRHGSLRHPASHTGQRRRPAGVTMADRFQNAASVRVTVETESEESESGSPCEALQDVHEEAKRSQHSLLQTELTRLQVELEECRLRLTEERNARLRTNSRVVELELENNYLRNMNTSLSEALQAPHASSSVLEDDKVLENIETSFHKFHAFLDLLKDAGLGQLASIAGIDPSDFTHLGQPQLSSTERKPRGAENEDKKDVAEETARGDGFHAPSVHGSIEGISGGSEVLTASPQQDDVMNISPIPADTSALVYHELPPLQPRPGVLGSGGRGASGASSGGGSGSDRSVRSAGSHRRSSSSWRDDDWRGKGSRSLRSQELSLSDYEGSSSVSHLDRQSNGSGAG